MKQVFLLLGSNRGDREHHLRRATELISLRAGTIVSASSIHETPPWGFDDPVPFLNQALGIDTGLAPEKLMETLLEIENELGRTRGHSGPVAPLKAQGVSGDPSDVGGSACPVVQAYAPRSIDIDILFFGNRLIFTENLMVPHPRLHEREFALAPLAEIAPEFVHPLLKKTVRQLLVEITGKK